MTPQDFVDKWSRAELSEKAASHEHFIDLCQLLGQPTPASADATGEDYTFEKHVKVVGAASKGSKGEGGFVDVWKRGHFAWEYKQKGKYKDLDEAYRQLYQYRDDLDNPPLSVVCDIKTTEIRTHFAGYPTTKITVKLEEYPGKLEVLRRLFTSPDSFRATLKKTETVTKELADEFAELATELINRYPPDELHLWETAGSPVAHFLMKVMFCLFAEDIGLLPNQAFTKLINLCLMNPEQFEPEATQLFNLMRTGGRFGFDTIPFFNGGLFDDAPALPLTNKVLAVLRRVAGDNNNWAGVEPSIFGTLFERILDPRKRAQIGAHYTSKDDILLVVEPVVMQPLRREWQEIQDKIAPQLEKLKEEKDRKKRSVLAAPIAVALEQYRQHLGKQRILDPACGSGNFLYVALQQLLDLEDEVVRFAARHDVNMNPVPHVRPTQLHGIEINPYAAELAQVVIWIGYLQWLHVHGIDNPKRPILEKMQTIECRDAILDVRDKKNPAPATWQETDFIIGNPPFLGVRQFRRSGLQDEYVDALFSSYDVPKTVDLCVYWFERARNVLEKNPETRVGLLATQGIRGRDSRAVLDRIADRFCIFNAWSDRNWILEGAAVHVSIVAFTGFEDAPRLLDGVPVKEITANLKSGFDAADARPLKEMEGISFQGPVKVGAFDIPLETAIKLLRAPSGPTGRRNSDVVRPWRNGESINSRYKGDWIIDFAMLGMKEAAEYEAPFEYIRQHVKPERDKVRREGRRERWWLFGEPNPAMRRALGALPRFVATCQTAKHRIWVWLNRHELAGQTVIGAARCDDYMLGILHSTIHELWARQAGTQLREVESGSRYTPTTCFETFPLPWPPGKEDVKHPAYARIAAAAKALDEQRERWLNPPEWIEPIERRIDAEDDFADVPAEARGLVRRSAVMAAAAKDPRLKKRTLTNLYNKRPTWLRVAHDQLDRAVLAAYAAVDPEGHWDEAWAQFWFDTGAGTPLPANHELSAERAEVEQKVLGNLLRLNHERASGGGRAMSAPGEATGKAQATTTKRTRK